jgi:hypothetical protein
MGPPRRAGSSGSDSADWTLSMGKTQCQGRMQGDSVGHGVFIELHPVGVAWGGRVLTFWLYAEKNHRTGHSL